MYKGRLPNSLNDLYSPAHGNYRKREGMDFHSKWSKVTGHLLYPVSGLNPIELTLCFLLSFILEYQTEHSIRDTLITGWILLLALSCVVSYFARNPVLPIKTFFVDHPVISCCAFGKNQVVISGGGGGLAYGIEDTVRVLEVRNSRVKHISGIPINLFSQSNNEFNPELADELTHTELLIGEQIPMVALWGMSASPERRLVAGGYKGYLQVYRQSGEGYECSFDIVLDDQLIPDQSRIRRPFIVNRTAFGPSGLLLAATSERRDVVVYALTPTKEDADRPPEYVHQHPFGNISQLNKLDPLHRGVIELGRTMLPENHGDPTDVVITKDEKFIVVATSKGYLSWFRIPALHQEYSTRKTNGLKGGPSIILTSEQGQLEIVQDELVPHDNSFFIRRMRLRPHPTLHRAELYFTGSYRPLRVRDRSTHGVMRVVYSTEGAEPKLGAPSPIIHRTALLGINAISFNNVGNLLVIVSNERFLVVNAETFSLLHTIARFPIGHEVDTLPTTSAAFIGE
eukprot:Gregarina_sp_Poly_1__10778@NODE_827_length_6114_cov_65_312882_g181_i1_p2_GENE_NODE_827_length_6114_cov_65_312882_g181_i1NODE_827_length_6114_cov_65_312882_g181_i1_p2_ORF_typecomplete_len512_score26_19ANAPC4_WD40/PF12894_7/9_2e03ANAPC4_WD40/PF12894_7/70ANAPC4_WD40/PF12894_7/2_6ANAPC4_WD40/PF12894_7/58Mcl1_mid/PF12341_8/29Mcl1_mid/PF12341_8/2_7SdiAregulated/PF06977_11/0_46_NODE_827_length_6114_cov_65_312882_g181_i144776012